MCRNHCVKSSLCVVETTLADTAKVFLEPKLTINVRPDNPHQWRVGIDVANGIN